MLLEVKLDRTEIVDDGTKRGMRIGIFGLYVDGEKQYEDTYENCRWYVIENRGSLFNSKNVQLLGFNVPDTDLFKSFIR